MKESSSVEKLADLLDTKFKGPFGFRFGLDGLIGLIPGVGDVVTTVMAFLIVLSGVQSGASPAVLLRMALNIAIDNLLSAIPFLGFVLDFFWKSNQRNLKILKAHRVSPDATRRSSAAILALVAAFALLTVGLSLYLAYLTLYWLFQILSGV